MIVIYRDKLGVDQMTPVPYVNEAEFQRVLKEHPELLRDSDEPQLCFLGQEVNIGAAGKADLLFLDADGRVSVDAELHHKAGDHAEKSQVGEKTGLDQVVEAVGAQRGPGAGDLDAEVALGGLEVHSELFGGFFVGRGRV